MRWALWQTSIKTGGLDQEIGPNMPDIIRSV